MKLRAVLGFLTFSAALIFIAAAHAGTINFDGAADRQVVNNLYSEVSFSADDGSQLVAFDWAGAGLSTTSSPMVLTTLRNTAGWVSHLNIVFAEDFKEIGAWLGNDHSSGVLWTLEVFDASGNSLGSNSIASNGNLAVDQYLGFAADEPFRKARFSMNISDKCIVLDDLYYNGFAQAAVVIPIPPAVWLLASGLAGIVTLRRRLTK